MKIVALYARVSSEKQAQANTIASQIAELENRIRTDGHELLDGNRFIDNGYSGSNLSRPSLEKLRDKVNLGEIDIIYIHSPDRLSRKYAYQMILIEELNKNGADIIFLNYQANDSPESQLLLQVQGMIAEYERAKIMERYRRGKIHAAKEGAVNVLSGAPYGYHYIDRHIGGGKALYEIQEKESEVVRTIFNWYGRERLSIGEICRRLKSLNVTSPTGKPYWDRSVIWALLKNPAYKGQAAFGKTKMGAPLPRIRPQKHSCDQPKSHYSVYPVGKENWIYIDVPAIIDIALFDTVQEQLEENKKTARARQRGASYLLQGLIVCQCCHYAYYGKPVKNKRGARINSYAYYRCIGTDAYRFGGNKICYNKQIRTDTLEMAVWEEVKYLLKNPNRMYDEYQRRMSELGKMPENKTIISIERQENKLKRGISRLIDSYTNEYIDKNEFEPRISIMKQQLKILEEQKDKIIDQAQLKNELTLIVAHLEHFSSHIKLGLENLDWLTQRDIIRTLVKRIEINHENVNVIFRIKGLPSPINDVGGAIQESLQHCKRSNYPALRRSLISLQQHPIRHLYRRD